jgi:hypothetical protein
MFLPLVRRFSGGVKMLLTGVVVVASNAVCHAQSCALCYTQAAGAGHRFIQGLRSGIFILIVPPMFLSVAITLLAYRKRNRCNDPDAPRKNSANDW